MPFHSVNVDGDHCDEFQPLLPNAVPIRDGQDSDTADDRTSFASSKLSPMELAKLHPLERPPDNDNIPDGLVEPLDQHRLRQTSSSRATRQPNGKSGLTIYII